ncbi:MAG: hypothetical protein ACHQZS_06280 [Candidatus Binatales bacterium]
MPEARPESELFCSRCGQAVIVSGASFCKECGAPLVEEQLRRARDFGWKPLIAAALSVVPGLGHFYRHRPFRGIFWFFGVLIAYTAPPLGYVMHMICAASAASIGTAAARALPPAEPPRRSRAWS